MEDFRITFTLQLARLGNRAYPIGVFGPGPRRNVNLFS